jgi:hypothetical protein
MKSRRSRIQSRRSRRGRIQSRRNRSRKSLRRVKGGMAPVDAPATILPFDEQAKIFLYPQIDDMRYNRNFANSRTPLLNTAVKWY